MLIDNEKTEKEMRDNLIVFSGNNLDNLPQDLFLLWKNLCDKYKEFYEVDLYKTTNEIEYNEEKNEYFISYNNYDECDDYYFHIFDASIGLTICCYENKKYFCMFFCPEGYEVNSEYFTENRYNFVLELNDELKEIYYKYKKFRFDNPDKYNKYYKVNKFKSIETEVQSLNHIICETCLYSEHCFGTFCFMKQSPLIKYDSFSIQQYDENVPIEQYKINLHILEPCNYRCKHCFAHFNNTKVLNINMWKHIVDNCIDGIFTHEFNIAGGEPFLYKDLDQLIDYINYVGAHCSIITNGSLMTDEWVKKNASKLRTIGFSIDSFDPDTLVKMGRCNNKKEYLSKNRFKDLCDLIKECNPDCKIKINTVVSQFNKNENILQEILTLGIKVDKWKILKMRVFKNEEFDNSDIKITKEEYQNFVINNLNKVVKISAEEDESSIVYNIKGLKVIIERDVQGGYIIIDANGNLIDNTHEDNHVPVINCATENFIDGWRKVSFDKNLYYSRYR